MPQDTGNPVLDSVVNIVAAWASSTSTGPLPEKIREVHAAILEIAEKEPGGLCSKGTDGARVGVK